MMLGTYVYTGDTILQRQPAVGGMYLRRGWPRCAARTSTPVFMTDFFNF